MKRPDLKLLAFVKVPCALSETGEHTVTLGVGTGNLVRALSAECRASDHLEAVKRLGGVACSDVVAGFRQVLRDSTAYSMPGTIPGYLNAIAQSCREAARATHNEREVREAKSETSSSQPLSSWFSGKFGISSTVKVTDFEIRIRVEQTTVAVRESRKWRVYDDKLVDLAHTNSAVVNGRCPFCLEAVDSAKIMAHVRRKSHERSFVTRFYHVLNLMRGATREKLP